MPQRGYYLELHNNRKMPKLQEKHALTASVITLPKTASLIGYEPGLQSQTARVHFWSCSMNFGRVFNHSGPQLSHLCNGDNNSITLLGYSEG